MQGEALEAEMPKGSNGCLQKTGLGPSKSWSLFVIVESSCYSGKRPYSCISHVTLKTK